MMNRDTERVEIVKQAINPQYVKTIAFNGDIYYTDDFYEAMYHKMKIENHTAVDAYRLLGFNTDLLTNARALSAGTRAIHRMEKKKAFDKNPADYDSEIPFEQMMAKYVNGSIKKEDLYANMAARLILLEEMQNGLKKTLLQYHEKEK